MAGESKELRGDAPLELVQALDALALAVDMNRHAYRVRVLNEHVGKELHRLSVLNSMLVGNPLLSERERKS